MNSRPPVISCAIQAHLLRQDRAEALEHRLRKLRPEIVYDPVPNGPPSTIRAAGAAWAAYAPNATHHLVVHDDIIVPQGFEDALSTLIRQRPREIIGLSAEWNTLTGQAVRMATYVGAGYTPALGPNLSSVGVIFPTVMIDDFVVYLTGPEATTEAHGMMSFGRRQGMAPMASVPSLVQHDKPYVPSLMTEKTIYGPRRMACYLDSVEHLVLADAELDGIDAIPYFPWHQVMCHVSYARTTADPWHAVIAREYIEAFGDSFDRLVKLARKDLARFEHQYRDFISPAHMFQVWLTGYLVGRILRTDHGRRVSLDGPLAIESCRTIVTAPLSRILPDDRLDAVGSAGVDSVRSAMLIGNDVDAD